MTARLLKKSQNLSWSLLVKTNVATKAWPIVFYKIKLILEEGIWFDEGIFQWLLLQDLLQVDYCEWLTLQKPIKQVLKYELLT